MYRYTPRRYAPESIKLVSFKLRLESHSGHLSKLLTYCSVLHRLVDTDNFTDVLNTDFLDV